MRRSGLISALAGALLVLASTSCMPYGFAGGGLPSNVRTVAVLPFENQTPSPDLQREVFDAMRRGMLSRLGLRDAPETRADAILRGTLLRYDTDIPVAFSADPTRSTTARRRLQIVLDIELVDQRTGKALWQRKGLTAEGEYAESAEPTGRRAAIDRLVTDVVEGAQSQW